MTEEEKKFQQVQLKYMKIQTAILTAMLVIVLAVGGALGYTAYSVYQQAQSINLNAVNETIESMEKVAQEVSELDLNSINGAVESLKEAAQTLSKADIAAINDGITALGGAADNLRNMDVTAMNELIESLQKTAYQMERTTNVLSKIFGK